MSGQLNAEAYALAVDRVYTFGPTFRAENSNTRRHLAEFWMIEPEMAFADLNDNADLAEDYVRYLIRYVLEHNMTDIEFFNKWIDEGLLDTLTGVAESDFERITYTQAIDLLEKTDESFEFPVAWGDDLQSEHERYLTERVIKKPVIVTDFPFDFKAFYMRRNDDGKTVAAMDVLVPQIGEIVGGSQREERLDVLADSMRIKGIGRGSLLVVSRLAAIRQCTPCRVRSRTRTRRAIRDRYAEHSGCHPVPAFASQRRILGTGAPPGWTRLAPSAAFRDTSH